MWSAISSNSEYKINPKSRDIRLQTIVIDNLGLDVTIHRTDTVSVIVSCSYTPVVVDVDGVVRLSQALARVKEMLSKSVRDCSCRNSAENVVNVVIPDHMSWIVTMWHFGADARLKQYI